MPKLRRIIFRADTGEYALPVTPASYTVSTEMGMQTIDVYEVGEYVIPNYPKRQTIKLSVLLPAIKYAFAQVSGLDQAGWVEWLNRQVLKKTRMRFIVSGTAVNVPVYIESVSYTEKDGTNDLYAGITLREYVTLSSVEVQTAAAAETNAARETTPQQTSETVYTVEAGDTLWGIARKYYGDGTLCDKLAAYNSIGNSSLIFEGQEIKLPAEKTIQQTQPVTQQQNKSAYYTLNVSIANKSRGIVQYHWTDPANGDTEQGEIMGEMTLAAGTRVDIYIIPMSTAEASRITMDGAAVAKTNHIALSMDRAHSLSITFGGV